MAQQKPQQTPRRAARAWMLTKAWILIAVVVTVFGAIHRNIKPGLILFLMSPFALLIDIAWHRLRKLTELPSGSTPPRGKSDSS